MGFVTPSSSFWLSAFSFSFSAWGIRPNLMAGGERVNDRIFILQTTKSVCSTCQEYRLFQLYTRMYAQKRSVAFRSFPLRKARRPPGLSDLRHCSCVQREATVTNPVTLWQSAQMTRQMCIYTVPVFPQRRAGCCRAVSYIKPRIELALVQHPARSKNEMLHCCCDSLTAHTAHRVIKRQATVSAEDTGSQVLCSCITLKLSSLITI